MFLLFMYFFQINIPVHSFLLPVKLIHCSDNYFVNLMKKNMCTQIKIYFKDLSNKNQSNPKYVELIWILRIIN